MLTFQDNQMLYTHKILLTSPCFKKQIRVTKVTFIVKIPEIYGKLH